MRLINKKPRVIGSRYSRSVAWVDSPDFKVQVPLLLLPVTLTYWQHTLQQLQARMSQSDPHWVCMAACSGAGKVGSGLAVLRPLTRGADRPRCYMTLGDCVPSCTLS